MESAPTEGGSQIKVVFTTTDESIQLSESKRQLLVPAELGRHGLTMLLNSEAMLDTPSTISFDFLINGAYLRTTLEKYLKDNGLSFESTVTLQYVRSVLPPRYAGTLEHDDWVSAVDVLSETSAAGKWSGSSYEGQERILSASYDGLLRIWNASCQLMATSPSVSAERYAASIKAAKFLSDSKIASASMDRTVRVWKYSEAGQESGELKPTLELYGHTGSVDSLAVDGHSKRLLTASSDGSVGLWATSKDSAPEVDKALVAGATGSKRRKVSSAVSAAQRGPLSMMKNHNSPATAAIFDPKDRTVAYSTSQDHTLQTIDLTTSRVVSTVRKSNALFSLAAISRPSAPLLAVGTSERLIYLIDPRESTSTTSVMTLIGHKNMVSTLAAAPNNDYSLVSGSHDGTCKIWDLRDVRPARVKDGGIGGSVSEPVVSLKRHAEPQKMAIPGDGCKVFSVVWDQKLGIVSGGEDKKVQIDSYMA
ncbi:ribosome biogenesis protein YTM1 [Thozetella sp. PMI_491]|nr:ribosome biogenesis protein YTM1 [Thozetella sp. PMI_491]